MVKDPICGMEVNEADARYRLHIEHETLYFCSDHCQETYARQAGIALPSRKKGVFARFLEKLAKGNQETFGGQPPKCH